MVVMVWMLPELGLSLVWAASQDCRNENCVLWARVNWRWRRSRECRHDNGSQCCGCVGVGVVLCCVVDLQEGQASVVSHPTCLRPCCAPHYCNGKHGLWDGSQSRNNIDHKYNSSEASKPRTLSTFFLLLRIMEVWQMIKRLQQNALSIVIQIGHFAVKENSVVFPGST